MSEKNNKMGEIFDMMFGNTEIEKEAVTERISVVKAQAETAAKTMSLVNILIGKGILTMEEYLVTNKAILKIMYESMKESLLEEQKNRSNSNGLFDSEYLKMKTDKHYKDLANALDVLILENTDEPINQEEAEDAINT